MVVSREINPSPLVSRSLKSGVLADAEVKDKVVEKKTDSTTSSPLKALQTVAIPNVASIKSR